MAPNRLVVAREADAALVLTAGGSAVPLSAPSLRDARHKVKVQNQGNDLNTVEAIAFVFIVSQFVL